MQVEPFARDELLAALQTTRLEGFDGAPVYEHATLTLETHDPDDLAPPQRYVLRDGVERILEVRTALLEHGVDPFALDGGVWLTIDGERIPLLPPIVEASVERDGRTALIISDGMHRVAAARSLGLPITVVRVEGVAPEHPYYAYAVEDGWDGVATLDELPDGFQKKEYRNPDGYRALFRLYNDVFPGVQQRRKRTNPAHLRA